MRISCSASAGLNHVGELASLPSVERTHLGCELIHQPRRREPSAARLSTRASIWPCTPADANHVELIEVGGVDGEELEALHQRHARVLGELEHALVEVKPGELAVDVERAVAGGRAPPRPRQARRRAPTRSCSALADSAITLISPGRHQHHQLAAVDTGDAGRAHVHTRACEVAQDARDRGVVADEQHVAEPGREVVRLIPENPPSAGSGMTSTPSGSQTSSAVSSARRFGLDRQTSRRTPSRARAMPVPRASRIPR